MKRLRFVAVPIVSDEHFNQIAAEIAEIEQQKSNLISEKLQQQLQIAKELLFSYKIKKYFTYINDEWLSIFTIVGNEANQKKDFTPALFLGSLETEKAEYINKVLLGDASKNTNLLRIASSAIAQLKTNLNQNLQNGTEEN